MEIAAEKQRNEQIIMLKITKICREQRQRKLSSKDDTA